MTTTITVPTLSLIFCSVSAILSIGVPILLVVLCVRRRKGTLWAVFTGTAWGFGIAILLHAGMDVFALLYQLGIITNIWLTEAALVVLVPIVCIGIWRVYKQTEITAA